MRLLPSHRAGRWTALGIAFTAIVMAAAPEKNDGAAKVPHSAAAFRANAASSSDARVELERLARAQPKPESAVEPQTEIGNAFGAISWYAPPPPPPSPPPLQMPVPQHPPAPAAPPMPFIYLGRYEDAPTLLAILLKGERMYVIAEGDVIEDTYRIERLTPATVELTYLPLDIRQSLSTGEAL